MTSSAPRRRASSRTPSPAAPVKRTTAERGRRSRARGLVFHMPGKWRLIFDVQQAGQRLRLTDTIDLP